MTIKEQIQERKNKPVETILNWEDGKFHGQPVQIVETVKGYSNSRIVSGCFDGQPIRLYVYLWEIIPGEVRP